MAGWCGSRCEHPGGLRTQAAQYLVYFRTPGARCPNPLSQLRAKILVHPPTAVAGEVGQRLQSSAADQRRDSVLQFLEPLAPVELNRAGYVRHQDDVFVTPQDPIGETPRLLEAIPGIGAIEGRRVTEHEPGDQLARAPDRLVGDQRLRLSAEDGLVEIVQDERQPGVQAGQFAAEAGKAGPVVAKAHEIEAKPLGFAYERRAIAIHGERSAVHVQDPTDGGSEPTGG
jgi:hypothetical protein